MASELLRTLNAWGLCFVMDAQRYRWASYYNDFLGHTYKSNREWRLHTITSLKSTIHLSLLGNSSKYSISSNCLSRITNHECCSVCSKNLQPRSCQNIHDSRLDFTQHPCRYSTCCFLQSSGSTESWIICLSPRFPSPHYELVFNPTSFSTTDSRLCAKISVKIFQPQFEPMISKSNNATN